MKVVILDIDGTLVDSNYQHALAWHRALRRFDRVVPLWECHRGIGMGGDQLVERLTDGDFEREHGDAAREAEGEAYAPLREEVVPLPGARDLIVACKEAGARVVLASSAKPHDLEFYVELLDAGELADAWTSSEDVEATKPAPDLVEVALGKLGAEAGDAVMIGDSTWDCKAATRAGVSPLAVRTGGFGRDELLEAGAVDVFDALPELIARLPQVVRG